MDAPRIDQVVHCIQAHRYRDRSIQPQTLEAKCLYDADKLDSIGAIGVARAFSHSGSHNSRLWNQPVAEAPPDDAQPSGSEYTPVHEYVYKLRRILATLYTATARTIGAQRHEFMARFYEQLDAEMGGRCLVSHSKGKPRQVHSLPHDNLRALTGNSAASKTVVFPQM